MSEDQTTEEKKEEPKPGEMKIPKSEMFDKAVEQMGGTKKLVEMAKGVAIGNLGDMSIRGGIKGILSMGGGIKSVRRIMSLWKQAEREMTNGNMKHGIELAKRSRNEIAKEMEKTGNAMIMPQLSKMLEELDHKIAFLETGKPISEYKPLDAPMKTEEASV